MPEVTVEPIRFNFDERKAAAAAAYLLSLEGSRMNYMRLLKLLYLAERQSLATLNRPIIGDTPYSMDRGPVLGRVYDLIKENREDGPWGAVIERDSRYVVRLKTAPDVGPLSDAELEILRRASELYRTHDQWALSDMTHDFPEWQDPHGSSIEIPLERVLEAFGKRNDEIERVRQNAREDVYFDRLFRG
jgi:uncharacterized phage-associated protein